MTPSDIPQVYEAIQPGKELHRFEGLDELMEFKYGVGNETGGKTMNLGRGALYAFLLGILLIVAPGLIGNVYSPIMGFVRETFGTSNTYYAVQNFLNFVTSGLMNLLAFEAWTVAVVLFGLSRRQRRQRVSNVSNFPTGGPSSGFRG